MDRTGLLGKIRKIFSIKFWKDRLAQLKSKTEMLRWKIRRKFWNIWTWLKFVTKSPMKISYPNRRKDRLELVVITKMIKGLDDLKENTPYKVPDRFPSDEKPFPGYWVKKLVFGLQAMLCQIKWFSPMQNGLPPIHKDPQWALDNAYSERGENLCSRPKLPPVFYDSPDLDSPDLGTLAVEGPYAGYLERKDDVYQWDLEKLRDYRPYNTDDTDLYKLGVKVLFRLKEVRKLQDSDEARCKLQAYKIVTTELGESTLDEHDQPDDNEKWKLAKKIALCALTNHTSLIRHWSWIHLIPATQLAFATRTKLGPDHPLRRLLWPHIYGTVQATKFGSMAQMAKGGDFENVFSFPPEEMCKLFNDSYNDFRLCRSVPELDLQARGIGIKKGKVEFSMPTHENLKELFNVLQTHVKNYLEIYYHNELFGAGDFKDPTSLAVKLRNAADLVSKFLQDQFSNTTQQLLREYIDATPPSESLQAALIQELNQILKGVSLYDKDRFTQVTLRKETQPLIEQNPKEGDLIRLNRFLLEDAYPQEIAKRQNFIHNNKELVTWLKTLHTGLPGGILEVLKNEVLDETIRTKKEPPKEADIQLKNVTLENVARLVASFIYLGSVQHEMMGSLLWNYQLWTHSQPTRVYKNGGREPLDVYQRLVNYNFMLMVKRTHLMNESTYCRMTKGLPKKEKENLETCYRQFVTELKNLQSKMDADPWAAWRIYPKDLEAHINA